MTNADKFKHLFGIYATELWAMPENDFLEWLNADAQDMPTGKWIPCSERLPEALQEVIVTSTAGYVYTSRIVHGDFEYGGNVIAWMPLPEPYKEDNP